jgi:hypothetical protein
MVSLKWGDVLSTLLPGALALFAVAPFFPFLDARFRNLKDVSVAEGFAFLIAAVLMGGVLEALTRITWEKYVLVRLCPSTKVLPKLTPENVVLYERGVQGSYKYATFYANFAWATILLLMGRVHSGQRFYSILTFILMGVFLLLLTASYVQWTYYVHYQTEVFGGDKDAEQRTTAGNEGKISPRSTKGKGE